MLSEHSRLPGIGFREMPGCSRYWQRVHRNIASRTAPPSPSFHDMLLNLFATISLVFESLSLMVIISSLRNQTLTTSIIAWF
ncbi:hypothetical protein OIDMADRAFT_16750 [Oidiodendron maius Zn]|uniref:Uncharacterized protein n=1 Tax=Oidiodendron maius (strain Zn) TaxID=913774 RepID=A0A0C3I0X0_OIDMZ|nr:hypothetical protein OIDMADRAFT_16750 [Oidiodendron maius Zn]